MKKKVAIVCGGPSREYEVSLKTAGSMLRFIDMNKYEVYVFYMSKDMTACLFRVNKNIDIVEIPPEEKLNPIFVELVKLKEMYISLLATHGEFGEDGKLQSILEFFDIRYSGSDSFSSSLCMDKYRSTLVVASALRGENLLIPDSELYDLGDLEEILIGDEVKFPKFVKPNRSGSSVGAYILSGADEVKDMMQKLKSEFDRKEGFLLQENVEFDVELSCGCLERTNGEYLELPPIEIAPVKETFFDYEAKYTKGACREIVPPKSINKSLSQRISDLAVKIHKILGCSVYSRSDFLLKGDKLYYIETNSLPGMTATSLLPQEAAAVGINFTELLDFLIENS